MGKQISVASSVYNLAGPESKRPQYLKSLIMGGVMQDVDSMGHVIGNGYLNGPGLRLRNFAKWARNNQELQDTIGITRGDIRVQVDIDWAILKANLPLDPGYTARIDFAEVGEADFEYWAHQYMALNYPDLLITNWTADYDDATNEITITFEDLTVEPPFQAAFYDDQAKYLYVGYTPTKDEEVEAVIQGNLIDVGGGAWPSVADYKMNFYNITEHEEILNFHDDIVVTYSDGRPDTQSSNSWTQKQSYKEVTAEYEKTIYHGSVGSATNAVYSIRHIRNLFQIGTVLEDQVEIFQEQIDLGGGVTATKTTTRTKDVLEITRQYRDDTQKIIHKAWENQVILIYKEGDGNAALDAFFGTENPAGAFFPPIPFRLGNKPVTDVPYEWKVKLPFAVNDGDLLLFTRSVNETAVEDRRLGLVLDAIDADGRTLVRNFTLNVLTGKPDRLDEVLDGYLAPGVSKDDGATWDALLEPAIGIPNPLSDIHAISEKAFKRALNKEFDPILESINDNESVEDIDHCYASFGVSLNVEENACKKYIYTHLHNLMVTTNTMSKEDEDAWWADFRDAHERREDYYEWRDRQNDQNQLPGSWTGADEPPDYPTIKWNHLHVYSRHTDTNMKFRTRMSWAFMHEITGGGLGKTGAKKGDLWFKVLSNPIEEPQVGSGTYGNTGVLQPREYRNFNQKVELWWQVDENNWKKLVITGLHHRNIIYGTKSVWITAKEAIQDNEESGFIVSLHEDTYDDMGMVDRTQMATACCLLVFNCYSVRELKWYEEGWFKVLVMVVIIVVAVVVTVVTVGFGGPGAFAGAAAIGGAIGLTGTAAIIAGVAISALAGLVVSFILTRVAVAIFGEKWGRIIGALASIIVTLGVSALISGANIWDVLTSADGLIALSSATGNAAADYMRFSAEEISKEMAAMMEKNSKAIAEIQRRYDEEFTKWRAIDPSLVSEYITEMTEKPDTFLARTLMTGSDIVSLNLALLDGFVDFSLNLELP